MAAHGKNGYISIGGGVLTGYVNTTQIARGVDTHDTTVYGNDAHRFNGGLLNNSGSMGGFFDSAAVTGSASVLEPIVSAAVAVELIWRPEGTGAGKPEDTAQVIITNYVESAPVADMITWTADFVVDGEITRSVQGP